MPKYCIVNEFNIANLLDLTLDLNTGIFVPFYKTKYQIIVGLKVLVIRFYGLTHAIPTTLTPVHKKIL